MKYMVDIDGTICTKTVNSNYEFAEPFVNRIKHFNTLYDQGHEICYWTARGGTTHVDWSELTKAQLKQWRVKYSSLNFGKPTYDIWIDDKAINDKDYFNDINNRG
jgi:uncharacterized HAD superfamily protein